MSIFEVLKPPKRTAEQGAIRVKRALAQAFNQAEIALAQVRQIAERYGAEDIQSALGNDRAEVAQLYGALKSLVETHKSGTAIPEMPTSGGPNRAQ